MGNPSAPGVPGAYAERASKAAARSGVRKRLPARAQLVAAAVVAGALVVGASVGVAADRTMGGSGADGARGASSLDRFAAELALSPAQRAAVSALLDERQRVTDSLVAPVRPQLDSVRLATRRQIRVRLTAAQQQRYDAYVARMEQEERARRRR